MQIKFYYNQSNDLQVFKDLASGETLEGTLRDASNIVNPIIMFQSSAVMRYNYCYIPEWQRYYFIREVESYRNEIYIPQMECDVLMSFKNDIMHFEVVVDKQTLGENGDEYIDDGSLVCQNTMFNRTYTFARGFNNTPEYILITAG